MRYFLTGIVAILFASSISSMALAIGADPCVPCGFATMAGFDNGSICDPTPGGHSSCGHPNELQDFNVCNAQRCVGN